MCGRNVLSYCNMVLNLCDECSTGCVKKLLQMKTPMYKFIIFVKSPVENAPIPCVICHVFIDRYSTPEIVSFV